MATVGANQWKGGFLKYQTNNNKMNIFQPPDIDPDSYLGMIITEHTTANSGFNGQTQ